ncbi:uncharacterized protein LOC141630687 [Silene latifolia]|uniref:uncharacterized protein LOC141630687 n=1 Tax=Silene latifolia TaxID=37657 RepID=UPI003D7806B9
MGCLNQSLLAKLAWRILKQPHSLLGRFLGPKYKLSAATVLSGLTMSTSSVSWGCRGVLWGAELLTLNLAWQIGYPSLLDVWNDKWVHGRTLSQCLSLSAHDLQCRRPLQVCQLQNAYGNWDIDLVRSLCGETAIPLVMAIAIPLEDTPDSIFWAPSKTGIYSVKSGYGFAFSCLWNQKATTMDLSRLNNLTMIFCKQRLWNLPISGKWRLFVWKILTNTLSIGEQARKRDFNWNYECSLCAIPSQIETLEHLFRDCRIASRFWMASPLGIRSSVGNNISFPSRLMNWISLFLKSDKPFIPISFFISTLWQIWCYRNAIKFRSENLPLSLVMNKLMTEASLNISVEERRLSLYPVSSATEAAVSSEAMRIRDFFPHFLIGSFSCPCTLRLKCDAAWRRGFKASAGWFFQTEDGHTLRTQHAPFSASSAFHAEAVALELAMRDALANGYTHLHASTDCLNLVYQVAGVQDFLQEAKATLQHITSLLASFHCFSINYCPRSLNRITHSLAKSAMV